MSRDQLQTPTGTKYGVEVWAYAIESDLQGRATKPPGWFLILVGDGAAGLILVFVHTRTTSKAWRYSLIAVPLLALFGSFIVFSSLTLWTLFLPTLLVVLLQQFYEDLQDYRKQKVDEIYGEAKNLGNDVKEIAKGFRRTTEPAFNPVDKDRPANDAKARKPGSRKNRKQKKRKT